MNARNFNWPLWDGITNVRLMLLPKDRLIDRDRVSAFEGSLVFENSSGITSI